MQRLRRHLEEKNENLKTRLHQAIVSGAAYGHRDHQII